MKSANELSARFCHTNKDSNTTIKSVPNEDPLYENTMMDLKVCGHGEDAYFEWVNASGDPIGDIFYEVEISDSELNQLDEKLHSKRDTRSMKSGM